MYVLCIFLSFPLFLDNYVKRILVKQKIIFILLPTVIKIHNKKYKKTKYGLNKCIYINAKMD